MTHSPVQHALQLWHVLLISLWGSYLLVVSMIQHVLLLPPSTSPGRVVLDRGVCTALALQYVISIKSDSQCTMPCLFATVAFMPGESQVAVM